MDIYNLFQEKIILSMYKLFGWIRILKQFLNKGEVYDLYLPFEDVYKIKNYKYDETYFSHRFGAARRVSLNREEKLKRYTLDNFVELESGDIFFDIGAYVGEVAIPASKKARSVYAFEPDYRSFKALMLNAQNLKNVDCLNIAVGDRNGVSTFYVSKEGSDDSLIGVDEGDPIYKFKIAMMDLHQICEELNIHYIDFVKIDAEGYEPEVLEGTSGINIRKFAIDCGKERSGDFTNETVGKKLQERGYEVREKFSGNAGCMVFAKK